MVTTQNEFETIPAFTSIAGDTLGTWTQREIACRLIETLGKCSQYDTMQLYINTANCTDDDLETMFDIQADTADLITDNCPLPDYCTIYLQDGEWLVMPHIDDNLPRYDDIPDTPNNGEYEILLVNDHGNVNFMTWNDQKREYVTQWAMV